MTMEARTSGAYHRALLLLQHNRPREAERELRQVLAVDPGHAMAHAMLSQCLVEQECYDEAEHHAAQAILSAPDEAMAHYAMSLVLFARNRYEEAGRAIAEAIRLDPSDADLYAMQAQVWIQQRRWREALSAAEQGLALEAEHVGCTNLRAMALVQLGEREEAGQTIDAALRKDPENALSHANLGWTLLHQDKPVKAMEHFREALRLDPTSEWARAGIVEALKAKHLIYRLMLRYFLMMSRLSSGVQWGIIIGLWILSRIVQGVAARNPQAAPYLHPIIYLYVVFVLMTWLSPHLFNLMLRLNKFGRHALSAEQRQASNVLGGMIVGAGGLFGVAWWVQDAALFVFAMAAIGLMLPIAGAYHAPAGWPRQLMFGLTALLAAAATAAMAVGYGLGMEGMTANPVWMGLMAIFAVGVIGAQILANILGARVIAR